MSAEVAFENLITAVLVSVRRAEEEGDDVARMAYFDVLEVGLSEAKQAGLVFKDEELRNLDPYTLLGRGANKGPAA